MLPLFSNTQTGFLAINLNFDTSKWCLLWSLLQTWHIVLSRIINDRLERWHIQQNGSTPVWQGERLCAFQSN